MSTTKWIPNPYPNIHKTYSSHIFAIGGHKSDCAAWNWRAWATSGRPSAIALRFLRSKNWLLTLNLNQYGRWRRLLSATFFSSFFLAFLLSLLRPWRPRRTLTFSPGVWSVFCANRWKSSTVSLSWSLTLTIMPAFPLYVAYVFKANKRRLSIHLKIRWRVISSVVSKTVNLKKGADNLAFPLSKSSTSSRIVRPHWKTLLHPAWE